MLGTARAQERDCRLDLSSLGPIIQRFNPFFAQHSWDPDRLMEQARLSADRLLTITQRGCIRHHTTFTLLIRPEEVELSQEFWLQEVKAMMYKVHHGKEEVYAIYGPQFEELFEEKLARHRLGSSFNFPIGTRNFVCSINYHPLKGGQVTLEVVEYIFNEKVVKLQPKGISRKEDDGWKGHHKP